jgi:hypothetical protein
MRPCVIDSMFWVLRAHPFWPPSLQTYTMHCNGKCIAHWSFKILIILNTSFKQTSEYVSNRNVLLCVEHQLCVVLVACAHQFQEAKGPETYRWAELISPLKSSRFQNSTILLARFLVCSTSDQVTADGVMHLEIIWSKCVSSMKICIFISLERCFCTVFCKFFEFIFDCTCASADQSRNAGMYIRRALLSLPSLWPNNRFTLYS